MEVLNSKIKHVFDINKNKKHVEFEFRFGQINNDMFVTNVGKERFEKVMKALEAYDGWEDVVRSSTSVYYKGDTRMSIDDDTEEATNINKTKITKIDHRIPDEPLDVRFCASIEKPTEPSDEEVMDYVRCKKRVSFIRKNLSIDMTIVTGQPDDLDDEEEETYEIELEIIDPSKVQGDNQFFNIVYKIQCVLNTLK
jgi:hypothetical protein